MTFFANIYDPDIIESALRNQGTKPVCHLHHGKTGREQLAADWLDLISQFSWLKQPGSPVKRMGPAKGGFY
jgi:hypothetical protein